MFQVGLPASPTSNGGRGLKLTGAASDRRELIARQQMAGAD